MGKLDDWFLITERPKATKLEVIIAVLVLLFGLFFFFSVIYISYDKSLSTCTVLCGDQIRYKPPESPK